MSDLKALTSSEGGFSGGCGGEDDDMRVPENSKNVFFSGWMSKFGARTQRRGSLGFSDSHIGTPPSRLDDDNSNSNCESLEKKFRNGTISAHSLKKEGLSRKRNDSTTDLHGMTPGDDGDLYFLKNKFRRNDSDNNLQDAAQSSIHVTTDGMLKLDIARSSDHHRETPMPGVILPTLAEEKSVKNSDETKYAHEDIGIKDTRHFEVVSEKNKKMEDSEGSIFLIDLEEIEDSGAGRTILKPQSKKFSASSILQSRFAQNWFFKNSDEDADTDCLVNEEEEESRKTTKNCDKTEARDSDKSILTKLKTFGNKTSTKHREMNFLQPQGT